MLCMPPEQPLTGCTAAASAFWSSPSPYLHPHQNYSHGSDGVLDRPPLFREIKTLPAMTVGAWPT